MVVLIFLSCEKRDFEERAKVVTGSVSGIEAKEAKVSGTIINLGKGITDHGHCWSKQPNPTVSSEKTSLGAADKTGTYNSQLTSLEPRAKYYYRSYARTGDEVVYGDEKYFTTRSGKASLTTADITDITINSAKGGGDVTSDGGDDVLKKGVCWDLLNNVSLNKYTGITENGTGTGSFTADLAGLIPGKSYYVKAYACTSVDTTYGNEKQFSTLSGIATLFTTRITKITLNSATGGGNITDDGGAEITARGICWSTSQNPTITDSKTVDGSGTGSFISSLSSLQLNTSYYVRMYATNTVTTSYGNQQGFTTKDGFATLTTTVITEITGNSATGGGNITDDGGAEITARGICWSTSQNPTITDSKTVDGSGTGSFTSSLSSLQTNTSYYVRTYATNTVTTSYGNQQEFTTLDGKADVTTAEVTDITVTSAICGGDVTSDNGFTVTARGVVWSTSSNPTVESYLGITNNGSGQGSFTSDITGLTEQITYYVRAYATNTYGTNYGEERVFVAAQHGSFTDSRDGNSYNWVRIGDQVWMAENLAYLPSVSASSSGSYSSPYYYVYGYHGTSVNDAKATNNYSTYGVLYNWPAAMQACPDGWHLPSATEWWPYYDTEWTTLIDYLGGTNFAGGKLKETGTMHWISPNTGATNETGFRALPGGCWYGTDSFNYLGIHAYFWSTAEYNTMYESHRAYCYRLYHYSSNVLQPLYYKLCGFSVRCLKD